MSTISVAPKKKSKAMLERNDSISSMSQITMQPPRPIQINNVNNNKLVQQFVSAGQSLVNLSQVPSIQGISKQLLLALYMAKCSDLLINASKM
jgi:hypothetical protein